MCMGRRCQKIVGGGEESRPSGDGEGVWMWEQSGARQRVQVVQFLN